MGLGIITLFFLACFSLLYIARGLDPKPAWLARAADKIASNIDMLAFWGMVYSAVSVILSPLVLWGGPVVVLMIVSNAVLFVLTLPSTLDAVLEKHGAKVPAAIASELKKAATLVTRNEKIAGFAGAALCFLLFVVLFR